MAPHAESDQRREQKDSLEKPFKYHKVMHQTKQKTTGGKGATYQPAFSTLVLEKGARLK